MSFLGGMAGGVAGATVSGLFNQKSAREQMEFQQYMDNTKYRRAAYDLKQAGLNRVIALGSPGSAPTGARASIDMGNPVLDGYTAASAKQQIKQSKATVNMQNEQAALAQDQGTLARANAAKLNEETRSAAAEADMNEVKRALYTKYGDDLVEALPELKDKDVDALFRGSAKGGRPGAGAAKLMGIDVESQVHSAKEAKEYGKGTHTTSYHVGKQKGQEIVRKHRAKSATSTSSKGKTK